MASDFVPATDRLARLRLERGDVDEAMTLALRLPAHPAVAATLLELAEGFAARGRKDYSADCSQLAVQADPKLAEAHNRLGLRLHDQRRLAEAAAAVRRAIELEPGRFYYCLNLAAALHEDGYIEEALDACRRALALAPQVADAHHRHAQVLMDAGRVQEVIAALRQTLELAPDNVEAAGALCFTVHYDPRLDARQILAVQQEWDERFARPVMPAKAEFPNSPQTGRRLRVGYVSADFSDHPVGRSILPVLREHNREGFETFCYSNLSGRRMNQTGPFRAAAGQWREVAHLSDEAVAQQIRDDRIDVLVDLSAHTAGSRRLAIARRPAPVILTHLAYPATTGISAIDYRVTDRVIDPVADRAEAFSSERLVYLPNCYFNCWLDKNEPKVTGAPKGSIVFGALTRTLKISDDAVELWASVLRAVAGSRLMLVAHSRHLAPPMVVQRFEQQGIPADRLIFEPRRDRGPFQRLYERIHITLDSLPYASPTSAMDSLMMGVPVVALLGCTGVGRGTASVLTTVGKQEWIAKDSRRYIEIAVELANDTAALTKHRAELRTRVLDSPLANLRRYTRDLEDIYRACWRKWCERGGE